MRSSSELLDRDKSRSRKVGVYVLPLAVIPSVLVGSTQSMTPHAVEHYAFQEAPSAASSLGKYLDGRLAQPRWDSRAQIDGSSEIVETVYVARAPHSVRRLRAKVRVRSRILPIAEDADEISAALAASE